MQDLFRLTATEAAELIASKQISSVELTQACLDRIQERNGAVGAWRHIDPTVSLAQAAEADRMAPKSPLHGVPFGVKDVIDTQQFPTEYGTTIHKGRRPTADAACVARMRAGGAVILGKLVTTEYAMFTPNETRHPLNLARTAGGSSSGTGAAVADSHVPIAFGNQTAGSLIRPAAYCGVFGLKATHGVVNTTGILPLQPFFDTLGYVARSVDDIQAFFSLTSGVSQQRELDASRKPKIALCRTWQWEHARPEARYVFEQTARQLAGQEVELTEFQLPERFANLVATHRTVLYKGISESLQADYECHNVLMSERLRLIIKEGRSISPEEYARQRQIAEECRSSVNELIGEFDALLAPSAPGEAPPGWGTGDPIFQVVWTLLGVPCLNLPVGFGPRGLPIGVQLIGKRHDDAALLALGKELMLRLSVVRMAHAAGFHD